MISGAPEDTQEALITTKKGRGSNQSKEKRDAFETNLLDSGQLTEPFLGCLVRMKLSAVIQELGG